MTSRDRESGFQGKRDGWIGIGEMHVYRDAERVCMKIETYMSDVTPSLTLRHKWWRAFECFWVVHVVYLISGITYFVRLILLIYFVKLGWCSL